MSAGGKIRAAGVRGLCALLGLLAGLAVLEASLYGLEAVHAMLYAPVDGKPVPGEYRIVCLGESTTATGGKDSWPMQLERFLKRERPSVAFRVINKGHTGITSTYLLARAQGYLRTLQPSLVIASIGINDSPNLALDSRPAWRRLLEGTKSWKLFRVVFARGREAWAARRDGRQRPPEVRETPRAESAGVPPQVETLLACARVYADRGWTDRSLKALETALALSPGSVPVRLARARVYLETFEVRKAAGLYEDVLAADPGCVPALQGIAECRMRLWAYPEAEVVCRRLLALRPADAGAWKLLGDVLQMLNREPEAESCLLRALELAPDNAGFRSALGWFYLDTGRPAKACEEFETLIRMFPGNAAGYAGLGNVYMETGELARARPVLARAIALNPADLEEYRDLARVCHRSGDAAGELGALKLAVKNNPRNALARVDYWRHLYACGHPVSDRLLQAPMRLDPDCSQGCLEAGLYYLYDRKEPEKAAPLLRRYAELASENARLDCGVSPDGRLGTRNSSLNSPLLRANYRRLQRMVSERGIPLVCVQYPLQSVAVLKGLFEDTRGLVFVDNEKVFRDALENRAYYDLFDDRFAGDFGHATPEGNRLLAENIGRAVLEHFFPADRKP